jgi:hypothetical protein
MEFKERKLPTEIKNIGVDSKYRDLAKFPTDSEYTVYFDSTFQNVVSVNLVFAVYEKTGTDLFVNLHIEELSPNLIANSNHISGSFCQLPMTTAFNTYDTSMYRCVKYFEKPLAKLSKLSIKFIDSAGKIYPMSSHFLKFEITCLKFIGREWTNNELFSNSVSVLQLAGPKKTNENVVINIKTPEQYNMDMLKTAFKSACDTLRSYGLAEHLFQEKYRELRREFKMKASKIL